MDLFLCPLPGEILTVGQGVLEVIAKIRTSGCTKLDRRPEKHNNKSANKPTSPLCLNAIARKVIHSLVLLFATKNCECVPVSTK